MPTNKKQDQKNLDQAVNDFLETPKTCEGSECIIDIKDNEVIERVNKKLVLSNGKQLLREVLHESN